MKKTIYSFCTWTALACGFCWTAEAQQEGGISTAMLGQIKQAYQHTAADRAIRNAISNNDIKAPYIGYSGVTTFDVNTKITSSGNKFNSTDTTKCMKKGATVAEATNLTAIH